MLFKCVQFTTFINCVECASFVSITLSMDLFISMILFPIPPTGKHPQLF